MSSAKRETWNCPAKLKEFFARPIFIPDAVVPDNRPHEFTDHRGAECAYIAGRDEQGAYLTIVRTFRPPAKKIVRPQLTIVQGGIQSERKA